MDKSEMTRREAHIRSRYASSYKPANEQYAYPNGMVTLGEITIRGMCAYETYEGVYRLRPHPDLLLPIEGFVGKRVGIKGSFTDMFAEEYDVKNVIQILEVREFYNNYYPDEEIKGSAQSLHATITQPEEERGYKPVSAFGIICSHCGGQTTRVGFKSEVIAHPERYQNLLCDSCSNLHPRVMTGMTFTQQQMEAAWKQMAYERNQDEKRAECMLDWVCQQTGIDRKDASLSWSNPHTGHISPWTAEYHFILTHQTYSPHLYQFIDALKTHAWAKHIRGSPSGPVYEVHTPEGTYEIYFSYFDNHGSGF